MNIDIHTSGGAAAITVTGELDMVTAGELRNAVTAVLDGGARQIGIDVAAVTFCDSSGLAALDSAYGEATRRGSPLRLTAVHPNMRRVLQITGMLDTLTGA